MTVLFSTLLIGFLAYGMPIIIGRRIYKHGIQKRWRFGGGGILFSLIFMAMCGSAAVPRPYRSQSEAWGTLAIWATGMSIGSALMLSACGAKEPK